MNKVGSTSTQSSHESAPPPYSNGDASSSREDTDSVRGVSKTHVEIGINFNEDVSDEYKRYTQEVLKHAEESLTDKKKKKVITNPGWHADKPGMNQIPINMESPSAQHGFGMSGETCCQNTVLFCSRHCGCPSPKTLRIGAIRVLARVIMAVLVWGFVWSVTFPPCAEEEEESESNKKNDTLVSLVTVSSQTEEKDCQIPGLPGSSLFGILMVFLCGMIAEALIVMIPMPFGLPPLPPLLGSLLVGILLQNVPGINVATAINGITSSRLRNMALGIILGRAGLEVDKKQMYNLRWVVPRLAFLPCIIEACSYGLFAHWILELPWEWSFMLGFVCGAVAPACVVPSMIKFQEEGYGTDHGVPSLLIAAASIDDIVAINVFNILLTITFGGESLGYDIGIAFAEIALGIALGVVGGFFLQKIPDRRQHNIVRDRTFLLIALSFFFIFVTDGPIDLAGAGTLGTLTCSFVAAIGWQHNQAEAVAHHFKAIWFYFQPLLFGLTGATVNISDMEGETIAKALGCMIICLAIRLTVAGNAVSFLGWSHKEKFMTSISWIPKATVQAAIGGAALSRVYLECGNDIFDTPACNNITDTTGLPGIILEVAGGDCIKPGSDQYYKQQECIENREYAEIILQVSVLLILITAPIGVFLIGVSGPKLLPRSKKAIERERNAEWESQDSDGERSVDDGVWATNATIAENGGAGYQNGAFDTGNLGNGLEHTKL